MSTLKSGSGSVANINAIDHEADKLYKKVAWRILPLLILCYAVAYFDRVNVSFAKLQMASQLGFSDTVYGLGAGIFFIGYLLAEVPSNLLLHRVGARRWFARILITWGAISASMVFTTSPESFYVLRFILGMAEAGFFPGVIYYLMQWFPEDRRSRATSLFYLGAPIAGVIGSPLSGFILNHFSGTANLQGWQWMFLIEAVPAVAMGIAILLYLDDRIGDAAWLSRKEKDFLEHRLTQENQQKSSMLLREVFRDRNIWLFAFTLLMIVMGQNGIYFWLPTIVKETGFHDTTVIGLVSAIPYAIAIIAVIVVGRMADRAGTARPWLLGACILGTCAFVAMVNVGGATLELLALTLATVCGTVMLPLFFTFPPAVLKGRSAAGGIALINSVGVIGGFVAPYLVGALRDITGAPAWSMYALAGSWLVAALLTLFLPRKAQL